MLRALQFNIENKKFDRIFVFIFLEKKNFLEIQNDYKTTQIIFFRIQFAHWIWNTRYFKRNT